MLPKGFVYQGRKIYFIEQKGKDPASNRWRAELYYKPGFAITKLFDSVHANAVFLADHEDAVYTFYEEFVGDYEAGKIRETTIEAPCPFCGVGPNDQDDGVMLLQAVQTMYGSWQVVCRNCLGAGPEAMKREEAIDQWNQRVKAE